MPDRRGSEPARYEDYLRKRRFWSAAVSPEERDALADALDAMRDVSAYSVLQHYGPYLVDADVMEKLNGVLARLDGLGG